VELSGGCVSSETCTELATILTILVPTPTPNPPQYDDLTIESERERNLEDGEQMQVLYDFQQKVSNSVIIKVDPYHIDKYLAEH
jgi:hypothetical protein